MPSADPRTCAHANLNAPVHVNTIVSPTTGKVVARMLTVSCVCVDCGTGFWFPGLPTGTSYRGPVTSTDGFELTVPLVEQNKQNQPDASLVTLTINNQDTAKGYRRP